MQTVDLFIAIVMGVILVALASLAIRIYLRDRSKHQQQHKHSRFIAYDRDRQ